MHHYYVTESGPTFVTLVQSRTRGPGVRMLPYLCSLVADRRLLWCIIRWVSHLPGVYQNIGCMPLMRDDDWVQGV